MKLSKASVRGSARSIPRLRFEDQQLTSFAGIVVFQKLFQRIDLAGRLRRCFDHLPRGGAYDHHRIALLLVVHLLLGYRQLRGMDFYRDDPMVLRCLGWRRMPDVSTVSRRLREMDSKAYAKVRELSRELVWDRLVLEGFTLLTFDFDGSVHSSKSRATEGTAIGYNKSKGERSYYPFFATIAQTGQVVDVLHRPGNVHDSNGAWELIEDVLSTARQRCPRTRLEARLDAAHFSENTCLGLAGLRVEFTISVPFERFPELKATIEDRVRWQEIDGTWAYFELPWTPKRWEYRFRVIVYRQLELRPRRGPLQLDIFYPVEHEHSYKVVITNKSERAGTVLGFHNGRGAQENVFGELKSMQQMDYIPTRRLVGNQIFMMAAILGHNLTRELQMIAQEPERGTTRKRAQRWVFEKLHTIRGRILQRAGRLTSPGGTLTLTMSANAAVAHELTHYLEVLDAA